MAAVATALAALAVGTLVTLAPVVVAGALVALVLIVGVAARPTFAAYLLIAVTPLIVGMERGRVMPLLRPNEAFVVLLATALVLRTILHRRSGQAVALRLTLVDLSVVLMAVTNSVVPLAWMLVRDKPVTIDDILHALVMWKLLGVFLIVRASVTTEREVRHCLWISLAAASVVAVLAILQSLQLLGVPRLLATYFSAFDEQRLIARGRGSSTLGLAAATADLMIFNFAIAAGLAAYSRRHRLLLGLVSTLFVLGTVASGQFSGAIGLVVGAVTVAVMLQRVGSLVPFALVATSALFALRPVVERRLIGFQTASGIPFSWVGRMRNLRGYFWPELFSHGNVFFGVRPAARVPGPRSLGIQWVWIESGYTWLLWGGGIPLFASYLLFVCATARRSWRRARQRMDAIGVAAGAAVVSVVVVTVLMLFDPHITYRGSADELFCLVALANVRPREQSDPVPAGGHG